VVAKAEAVVRGMEEELTHDSAAEWQRLAHEARDAVGWLAEMRESGGPAGPTAGGGVRQAGPGDAALDLLAQLLKIDDLAAEAAAAGQGGGEGGGARDQGSKQEVADADVGCGELGMDKAGCMSEEARGWARWAARPVALMLPRVPPQLVPSLSSVCAGAARESVLSVLRMLRMLRLPSTVPHGSAPLACGRRRRALLLASLPRC